jgi:hypothetical protein
MKTIATFSTVTEAQLALSRLESAGVEAVMRDEFMVTNDWLSSNAVGGVKIDVIEEDATVAREILGLPAQAQGLIHCPFCGSSDTYVRVLSGFAALCLLLKLPLPLKRATIDCRACGQKHTVPLDGHIGPP